MCLLLFCQNIPWSSFKPFISEQMNDGWWMRYTNWLLNDFGRQRITKHTVWWVKRSCLKFECLLFIAQLISDLKINSEEIIIIKNDLFCDYVIYKIYNMVYNLNKTQKCHRCECRVRFNNVSVKRSSGLCCDEPYLVGWRNRL